MGRRAPRIAVVVMFGALASFAPRGSLGGVAGLALVLCSCAEPGPAARFGGGEIGRGELKRLLEDHVGRHSSLPRGRQARRAQLEAIVGAEAWRRELERRARIFDEPELRYRLRRRKRALLSEHAAALDTSAEVTVVPPPYRRTDMIVLRGARDALTFLDVWRRIEHLPRAQRERYGLGDLDINASQEVHRFVQQVVLPEARRVEAALRAGVEDRADFLEQWRTLERKIRLEVYREHLRDTGGYEPARRTFMQGLEVELEVDDAFVDELYQTLRPSRASLAE